MKYIFNQKLREKFKGNKYLLFGIATSAYTAAIIFGTTIQVRNGFLGQVVLPLIRTNIKVPINYVNSFFI